jgi:hypothetical protein
MKTVKIAPATINAVNAATIQNNLVSDIIGFLNSEADKVPAKPVKAKEMQVQTWNEMLTGNKALKLALSEECKKLGYALSILEKFKTILPVSTVDYLAKIRENKTLYIKCEMNVTRSTSGNITPFNLQKYIRTEVNLAAKK